MRRPNLAALACLTLLAGIVGGCASRQEPTPPSSPVAAAALAYAPPAIDRVPGELLETFNAQLARGQRGEVALLGYDSPRTSIYVLDYDDRQRVLGGFGSHGRFGYGRFGGFYGSSVHGGRVYDDVYVQERVFSTFQRTRPAGELN